MEEKKEKKVSAKEKALVEENQNLISENEKLKAEVEEFKDKWMRSRYFRYGFLIFFLTMFAMMIWNTWLVFSGAKDLAQVVTLFWTFRLPWHWAYHGTFFSPGVAQFAFGFYSLMLTSTLLGLITMVLFKPRSWCVYCPMGTMTQTICKIKAKSDR